MIQIYRRFRSRLRTGDIVATIADGTPVLADPLGVIIQAGDLGSESKSDDVAIYTVTGKLKTLPQYLHEVGSEVVAVAEPLNRDKIASIVRMRAKEALEAGVADLVVSSQPPVIEKEQSRTSAVEITGISMADALRNVETRGLIIVMRMTCPDHHNPEPCPLCP
jgi:hypothetical protein